jgi:hypothetical protein
VPFLATFAVAIAAQFHDKGPGFFTAFSNVPTAASDGSRARENENPQNELLEQKDGKRLDTRATGTAGRVDPAMATLGEINRTEKSGG